MRVSTPFPFICQYVEQLHDRLYQQNAGLTPGQRKWLSFSLMCILVTESVCWRRFVRASLGQYSEALLSWYFRAPVSYELLLRMSVHLLIENFSIYEGILVLDDTGKKRSKATQKIPYVHYFKSPDSSGTTRGQQIILLALVTPTVTIPIAFEYYQPDPVYSRWAKVNKRLKKQGIVASHRPKKPPVNPLYPSKQQLALTLLEQFALNYPLVKVKAVLADALYGNAHFMEKAYQLFNETQVISQLRCNQKIDYRGRSWRIDEYFKAYPGVKQTYQVRGGKTVDIMVSSARLYVRAQACKRFVIAIRYPHETRSRYLIATHLSWRTLDIVKAYTLRWLVEVVIEDLKVHEGWGSATKQPGVDGSRKGLTLSLLCDHCLLLHPEQLARVKHKQPLFTIGSLQRHLQMQSFISWLSQWLDTDEFTSKLAQLTEAIKPLFPLQPSGKHMNTRELGRLEPSPSLRYR